jgi:hypothetical protein
LLVDDHLVAESGTVRLVSTAVLVDRATRRVSRPEHGFRSPRDVVNADATDQPPRPEHIEVRAVLLVRGAARFQDDVVEGHPSAPGAEDLLHALSDIANGLLHHAAAISADTAAEPA